MPQKPQITIFWFRRDLRWSDNTGLNAAFELGYQVLPLFIFDTQILKKIENRTDPRVNFIYNTLKEMHENAPLLVKHGTPIDTFNELLSSKDYEIKAVFCNSDYEPYAISRDQEIQNLCRENGILFQQFKDQVIFEKDDVIKDNGQPYQIYTPYSKQWIKQIQDKMLTESPSQNKIKNIFKIPQNSFPTLENLGFKQTDIEIPSRALPLKIIKNYHQTRDFPALIGTSKLGIHLRFGTLSVRKAVKIARANNETWLKELIWREFFMMLLYHFPHTVDQPFNQKFKNFEWRTNKADFETWCQGQTGVPIVDAGMRELVKTGHMHNRVRMITASFLVKNLLIDWRLGERFFAGKLLDYDLSANIGNWQWIAGCGCDAAPFFRIFNPEIQAKKFDENNFYIKKWVPEFNSADYLKRNFDFKESRLRALQAYKII